jgi:hypothetical protein
MPKLLFYTGTAFCLFLALSSAAVAVRDADSGASSFVAIGAGLSTRAAWAIVVALFASLAVSSIFLRMAALVAARNLFAAFVAVFAVAASVASLVGVLMLEARMLRQHGAHEILSEAHLAAVLTLGWFVSMTLLAMRPYFRVQASRILSMLVFLPLPLFTMIIGQELFVGASRAPLPATSPALIVYFAVLSILFFAIGVHCVRHRYLFLEMTNLRELLDSRVDPASRAAGRRIGGVAFDS